MFGILYLIYTVWAAKKSNDNIGHDAHFGGAVAGLLIAMILKPEFAIENWLIILAMMAPIVYFLFDVFSKSKGFSISKILNKDKSNYSNRSVDDLYNFNRSNKIKELNNLLEKVNEKGIESLTLTEKERLNFLSKDLE